jgi:hypothetical protein
MKRVIKVGTKPEDRDFFGLDMNKRVGPWIHCRSCGAYLEGNEQNIGFCSECQERGEHWDWIRSEGLKIPEFNDYVVVNNRQDRDSGELNEVPVDELERLWKEWTGEQGMPHTPVKEKYRERGGR